MTPCHHHHRCSASPPFLYPQDLLPNYRRVTQAYYDAVTALMRRSLHILALSLDLPRDHFDAMFAKPIASLRPLHYRRAAVMGGPCDGLSIKVDV